MNVRWASGCLVVTRRGRPDIRFHWTLPIGAAFFGMLTLGGAIGFVVMVLVHDGHAGIVRRQGLRTVSIDLHWLGGECRFDPGRANAIDHALIAWGGVLAQSTLLVAALFVGRSFRPQGVLAELLMALIIPNGLMIAFNLLPFGGLDGVQAWRLPGLLWRRWRREARLQANLRREVESILRRKKHEAADDDDEPSS